MNQKKEKPEMSYKKAVRFFEVLFAVKYEQLGEERRMEGEQALKVLTEHREQPVDNRHQYRKRRIGKENNYPAGKENQEQPTDNKGLKELVENLLNGFNQDCLQGSRLGIKEDDFNSYVKTFMGLISG